MTLTFTSSGGLQNQQELRSADQQKKLLFLRNESLNQNPCVCLAVDLGGTVNGR